MPGGASMSGREYGLADKLTDGAEELVRDDRLFDRGLAAGLTDRASFTALSARDDGHDGYRLQVGYILELPDDGELCLERVHIHQNEIRAVFVCERDSPRFVAGGDEQIPLGTEEVVQESQG